MITMFFCPSLSLRQRLRHRRATRQQRHAMKEAAAAGWNNVSNEMSSEDDDLENEHNLWTTTTATKEDAVLEQYFNTAIDPRKASKPASFGTLKLFTPEYFQDGSSAPPPAIVPNDDDDSSNDDSVELLQEIAPESALSAESMMLLEHLQANDVTETTEATSTSVTEPDEVEEVPRADTDQANDNKYYETHSDDDVEDGDSISDDSVDYGGAETTMWKSVGMSFSSPQPIVEEPTPRPPPTSTDIMAEDDNDEEDVDHQGAQVFLYTEQQNNYTNNDTNSNMLFNIQEAPMATETERIMEQSNQETFAETEVFQPRIAPEDNNNITDEDESGVWEDLNFTPNGTYKSPNLKLSDMLVSPGSPPPRKNLHQLDMMSPLSAMVHPMNLELFRDDDDDALFADQSFSSIATESVTDNLSISSCPVRRSDLLIGSNSSVHSSRTAASFRSSTSKTRVRYSLSKGKKSMSKEQRHYSKAFLPKSLLPELCVSNSTNGSKSSKGHKQRFVNNSTLSVLLVHVQQHVFEVIAVDCYYKDDCTVGDVLSKARSSATDPALSEQKYVSLVFGRQEFAAPMLPIHVAVDFRTKLPLALAVPEGSTSAELQAIKRVLWKNPKMKRWWNVEDPFQLNQSYATMDSIREIHVPSPKTESEEKQATEDSSTEGSAAQGKQEEQPAPESSSPKADNSVVEMLCERTEL